MALFLSLWFATAAAWAVPGQEPGLLEERELTLTLCPITVELDRAGRIREVRFAFVPFGLRTPCQGRFVRECRLIARDKGIPGYARHKAEPERVLEARVGLERPELTARLARLPAVRALRERVDVTWTPAGEGKEYPLDKKRTVTARLRWRVFVNTETLDVLDVVK